MEALTDNVIRDKNEKEKTLILVKKETERLIKLTRELKSLSLLESDHFNLIPEKININKLIKNTLKNFNLKIKSKKLIIKENFASNLPAAKIDPNKFQQAFSNIIDNAINHTPAKGEIKIKTEQKGDLLIISVKDSGKGIKKEDLPFIFERFYQGNKSRSGQGENIGIGLTIVKKIVEAHQGKIEVFSQKNKGAQFIISLPKN
jgi:two-component system sensor histidine kinase ResE